MDRQTLFFSVRRTQVSVLAQSLASLQVLGVFKQRRFSKQYSSTPQLAHPLGFGTHLPPWQTSSEPQAGSHLFGSVFLTQVPFSQVSPAAQAGLHSFGSVFFLQVPFSQVSSVAQAGSHLFGSVSLTHLPSLQLSPVAQAGSQAPVDFFSQVPLLQVSSVAQAGLQVPVVESATHFPALHTGFAVSVQSVLALQPSSGGEQATTNNIATANKRDVHRRGLRPLARYFKSFMYISGNYDYDKGCRK